MSRPCPAPNYLGRRFRENSSNRDSAMTLSEFLALRDSDPHRYEQILERVARQAAEAQWRLMQRRRVVPQSAGQSDKA